MIYFSHEKLNVYQEGLDFIKWFYALAEKINIKGNLFNQLDRAANSIVLNIAEGNGKYTPADRCRFFDIAKGSTFECAAALDILVAQKVATEMDINPGKEILKNIVNMLIGLIRNNSNRVYEHEVKYTTDYDKDHDHD